MEDPREVIRGWLLDFARNEHPPNDAVVPCIMAQHGWRFVAERLLAIREQGFSNAFALEPLTPVIVALYEHHGGPHLTSCPNGRPDDNMPATDSDDGPE